MPVAPPLLLASLVRFLVFPSVLVSLTLADSGAPDKEEPWCVLYRFNIRTSTGVPVQFVTNEDGSIDATLCADMPNFFVSAEPVEPTFSSGKKCQLAGVPGNPVPVEQGKHADVEIYTYESDPKTPAEKSPLRVTRLSLGENQDSCALTRVRSAAEDCGYAPFLEEQRQVAAMNPGAAMSTPEAPVSEVTVGAGAGASAFLEEQQPAQHRKKQYYVGGRLLRKLRSKARGEDSNSKPKRRSAKWSHLRHRRGISGLDGC